MSFDTYAHYRESANKQKEEEIELHMYTTTRRKMILFCAEPVQTLLLSALKDTIGE